MSSKLLLEQVLIDNYNPSAFNSNQTFGSTTQSAASQSFTGTGNAIAKAQFYLGLVGSGLTGNVVATIYAHSGTYGTSSIPTGTALATSDTIDSSTLGLNSGITLVTFTFSGANQITLTNGTNYVLAIEKTTLASDTGYMSVMGDSSGTHSGNSAFKNSGTWFSSAKDLGFTLISTDAVTTQSLLLEDGTSYLLLEDPVLIPDSYALSSDTSTSPLTWNHTIGNGTDRMLVVATALQGGTQGTVTAVTYNGVALTKAVGKQNLTGLGGSESTLWLLPNPPQGTYAVSVTATLPTTPDFTGASMSYFNAVQSTTPDATGTGSGATAGTSTAAITTVNTGAWTIGVMNFMNNGSTTGAITSSQTVREAAGMAININGRISVVDSGAAVTAGANTVSYSSTDGTGADSRNYTIAAISLAPVRSVAGGGAVNGTVAQVAATVTASGGTQAISATAIASASVTQLAATVTATGGTQAFTAAFNTSVTQVAATVTATGGTQTGTAISNAAITQLAATVTASGGTQTVTSVRNVSIGQVATTVTATGGTESVTTINAVAITQLAGVVTASGGTQTLATVSNSAVTQLAATVTASGGTETLSAVQRVAITQTAGTVTATGGTETVNAAIKAAIAQAAGTVTASGGTQALVAKVTTSITQVAGSVTASGGMQSTGATVTISISQVAATVTASGGFQVVHGTSIGHPGYPKVKIGGVEVIKPLKYKSGGVFIQKPLKVKIGGVWTAV